MKKIKLAFVALLFIAGCGVSPTTPSGFNPGIYKGTVGVTTITSVPSRPDIAPVNDTMSCPMNITVDNSGRIVWMGVVVENGAKIHDGTSGTLANITVTSCNENSSGISVTFSITIGITFPNGSSITEGGSGIASFQFKDGGVVSGGITFYESFLVADSQNNIMQSQTQQGFLSP
jgi:PBP1b-binding outer membrane lipoprotein LpoB